MSDDEKLKFMSSKRLIRFLVRWELEGRDIRRIYDYHVRENVSIFFKKIKMK